MIRSIENITNLQKTQPPVINEIDEDVRQKTVLKLCNSSITQMKEAEKWKSHVNVLDQKKEPHLVQSL